MDLIPNKNLPRVGKKEPARFIPEPGKIYSWCTCGLTQTEPFCDGAHKMVEPVTDENGASKLPFRSLKIQFDTADEVWLCQCKQTKTPPFCDGSHNNL